jgi:hypothetical protein
MRNILSLGAIAFTLANVGFLASARPADAAILNFSDVKITLNFRPELLAQAQGLAMSAGITLPHAATSTSPTVRLTGTGTVDTTSRIASITLKESVAVTVRGLTVTGNSCVINNTSSTTALLSCVVGATPRVAPRRVPLIKFTGNSAALLRAPGSYSASSVGMEVPTELATLVNGLAGRSILTAGLPLGTASGTAKF